MLKYRRGLFLLFLAGALMTGEVEAGSLRGESELGAAAWSTCNGTVGECLGGEEAEDMAMDSESNRRILQGNTNQYVAYKPALYRDQIQCGIQGVSYSNCRETARYEPYVKRRPCLDLYKCGRGNPPPAFGTHVRN